MNIDEFNEKYKEYLEEGHYGLAIENKEVIKFLDKEFEKHLNSGKKFSYSQIKMKFKFARVYTTLSGDINAFLENKIEEILCTE